MKILHLNGKPLYAVKSVVNPQEKLVYLSEYGKQVGLVSMRFFDAQNGYYDTPQGRFQWVDIPFNIVLKDDFAYRKGPDGYAQYYNKNKGWRSSATVRNDSLG